MPRALLRKYCLVLRRNLLTIDIARGDYFTSLSRRWLFCARSFEDYEREHDETFAQPAALRYARSPLSTPIWTGFSVHWLKICFAHRPKWVNGERGMNAVREYQDEKFILQDGSGRRTGLTPENLEE
jgi:hypothetical protein